MADVAFTPNLQRHVECPPCDAPGSTVREVLEGVFADNPRLRGYIVDERGALRRHMIVFVDGRQISDRERLSDRVGPRSEVYVMQALSGGS
jgi:hypothetical protein